MLGLLMNVEQVLNSIGRDIKILEEKPPLLPLLYLMHHVADLG
jgi:hypothetical protein